MTRPQRADALLVLDRLHDVGNELLKELLPRDPEGRSFSLGICMWLGTVLATMKEEYRQEFCEGAMGYALTVDNLLDELRARKKP